MALLGKGVLAIWNGIKPEAEDEFVAWHVREHIPERVGLSGFLRGRRYIARDGHPKYFNFYETSAATDLSSPVYQARLNAPTDWTRQVVAHFTDTSRTICEVAWSIGLGEGGFVEAIQLRTSLASKPFATGLHDRLSAAIATLPGIVGVHLLKGQPQAGSEDTAEKQLRGAPDKVADWILLVEASRPEAIEAYRAAAGSNDSLGHYGAAPDPIRGLYQLQFALTKAELSHGESRN